MTVAATTARYAFSFSSASPISSLPFVRNALVAGVLISLSAALLGVPLVLKRLSFIGDGLSHVAFGAMAVAGVLNFADSMSLSLPVTIICALVRHGVAVILDYIRRRHGAMAVSDGEERHEGPARDEGREEAHLPALPPAGCGDVPGGL